MEENAEQISLEAPAASEPFPTYLSVKEAARFLGVSERSVYGYIESGKLSGARLGKYIVVRADAVYAFQRRAPGRVRAAAPPWRRPPFQNREYLTTITVRVYPGQNELLESRLAEVRATGRHRLPGTAARYIVRSQYDPGEITIILVWRSAIMPSAEVRAAALAALYTDFADVLNWETATLIESRVLMHA